MPVLDISLADQNALVNYLSYNLSEPDVLIWLIPENYNYHFENIQKKVDPESTTRFITKNIPENDLPGIINICKKIEEEYEGYEIQINVTGGKKVQALIITNFFYKVAKKIFYVDVKHSRIYDILNGETTNYFFDLTVNEYLEIQGIEIEAGLRFDPEIGIRSNISYYIGNNIYTLSPFIDKVRDEYNHHQQNPEEISWDLDRNETTMKVTINPETEKIVFQFNSYENQNTIEMDMDKGIDYFLQGGWLKELTFLRIHKGTNFDARLNIELKKDTLPQGERLEHQIDIGSIKGSCLYLFQCFAYPINRNSYFKLKSLRSTKDLLHADAFIMLAHKPNRSFVDQAHSDGIKIVYGKRISKFNF